MSPNDADIMGCVQAGQVHLFDELVRRYRPVLLRVAFSKLGNSAWAEDVVQETFLAAFAARQSYKPQFAFRTWLWTILLNLCRRHWQRRQTRKIEEPQLATSGPGATWEPATHETGLALLLHTERRERVQAMLEKLPEPQADAIRLRFLAELLFAEIALTMDSSLSAAKQRVKQGLLSLAKLLADDAGEKP